jgi:ATP-dependent exoDNAse (exonuclease V) beta subunit
MKKFLLEKLEEFNDSDFIFDPIKHRYTYLGEEFTSVTRFIQQFHKPFEQQYWSQRKAEEAGVPQEWILNEWKKLNYYANEVGTEKHNCIEDYFNKNWRELPTNLDVINRINKFNIIYAKQLHKLEPLKFEVRIFSKKWKIAGMVDALFLYRGRIYIIDYKTNKNFTTDENTRYPEKLLVPFSEFNKNHLNEYSIQISLYALILKEWGFDVAGGYLVYIGPGEEPAKMYKCVNMVDILHNYLNGGQLN